VSIAVEGWGPFRAPARHRAEMLVPAAGTDEGGTRRYLAAVSPWRRSEAVVPTVLALVGAVGVGGCWNGASREVAFRDQIGWTVGGFAFLGLFALAGVLWLMVGFRRVRHGVHELQADMAMVFRLQDLEVEALVGTATADQPTGLDLVVAPGMSRAHRPDCMLARGKQVRALTPSERGSYPPCGMCLESS
jgi:hypothetical protein